MESKVVKADFKKLDAFAKAIRDSSGMVVRVGIFGQKNTARKYEPGSTSQTNADIGFIHEFGQPPHIPQRSFLRMPIFTKINRIMNETEQDVKTRKLLEKGNLYEVLRTLGIACERAILDAFDSRGFGSWKANAPSTVRRKGSNSPLIDFGFLRKSISSEVVKI